MINDSLPYLNFQLIYDLVFLEMNRDMFDDGVDDPAGDLRGPRKGRRRKQGAGNPVGKSSTNSAHLIFCKY